MMIKEGVNITYEDGSTEFFKNKTPYNFWDKCDRIVDVKGIKEMRGDQETGGLIPVLQWKSKNVVRIY